MAKSNRKIIESEENYFDIIFMDIQMPVMNGYEATRIIRKMQREDMKNIPIIAMSAYAFSDDLKKQRKREWQAVYLSLLKYQN